MWTCARANRAPSPITNALQQLGWSPAWRALRRWRKHRNAVASMQALDDRMLKDIGIDRSEIDSVVRGSGRDASRVNRA